MSTNKSHISRKRPVVNLLWKVFAFVLIVFILDFTSGRLLRHFYFKQESGLLARTTYAINETTADVLIFGSSRANHHYQPKIFESQLKTSYYNLGRDGNYIFYHYALLQAVLKRYTPKLIILDVVHNEFELGEQSYDRLSSLLPYYHSHPEMRPIIHLKSKYEKLKLISQAYPYNSSLFTIAIGNTDYNKKRSLDIKGYVPLFDEWSQPIKKEAIGDYPTDSIKTQFYRAFLKDCISKGIKLYVVCSPYYKDPAHQEISVYKAKIIAKELQVPFLDYSRDTFFLQRPFLFSDVDHLNDYGATLFTEKLIADISKTTDTVSVK